MIPLEQIKIASPCHANWEEMAGTDQARFCQSCRKNVYNLSEMTRAEAEALIQEKEGRLCVRFYTRADGTLLTQDCPVGIRALRVKLAKKLSYAAALLLAGMTGLLRGAKADGPQHGKPLAPPVLAESHFPKPHSPKPTLAAGEPIILECSQTEIVVTPTIISQGIVIIDWKYTPPPNLPPPPGHTRR